MCLPETIQMLIQSVSNIQNIPFICTVVLYSQFNTSPIQPTVSKLYVKHNSIVEQENNCWDKFL